MVEQRRIYFIAANFSAVESRREKAETGQPAAHQEREREGRGGKEVEKRTPLAVVPRLVGPKLVNLARLVGDGLRVQLGLLLVVLSPAQKKHLATGQQFARRVREEGVEREISQRAPPPSPSTQPQPYHAPP